MQLRLQRQQLFLGFTHFFHGHFAQVRVTVLEQRLGTFEVVLDFAQLFISSVDRLDFGVFTGIGAKARLVGNDLGITKQSGEFFEAVLRISSLFSSDAFIAGICPSSPR